MCIFCIGELENIISYFLIHLSLIYFNSNLPNVKPCMSDTFPLHKTPS